MKVIGIIVGALVSVGVVWTVCVLPFIWWHYETASGVHTGYITAVEKTGVIWKTGRAYLKTDTQSSQEDAYCVVDPDVYAQLQKLSEQKAHVNAFYVSWLVNGITKCSGEDAVIYKVEAAQ